MTRARFFGLRFENGTGNFFPNSAKEGSQSPLRPSRSLRLPLFFGYGFAVLSSLWLMSYSGIVKIRRLQAQ